MFDPKPPVAFPGPSAVEVARVGLFRWQVYVRYWLPCPLCDRPYGGHERAYLTDLPSSVPDPTNPPCHVAVCPPCTRAGRGVAW